MDRSVVVTTRSLAAALICSCLLLAGCATGPNIVVNENPTADFSQFKTYGFAQPLGTDRAEYSSLLSQYLTVAASREMDARGYRQAEDPDLQLNFFANTKDKIRTTQTPTAGVYYGYRRGRYDAWGGYETRVTQFTEGMLTIDVVDAQRKQLVWEASISDRVREEDKTNLEAVLNEALTLVFAEFPYTAN